MNIHLSIPNLDEQMQKFIEQDIPMRYILSVNDDNFVGAASIYDLRNIFVWNTSDIYDAYNQQYDHLQKWAQSVSNDLLTLVKCMMVYAKMQDMSEEFLTSPKIILELLMINKEYRNKGLATGLLNNVKQFFNCDVYGYVGNPLDKEQSTQELLDFYSSCGYENYYMGDDDYLIVQHNIP